MDPEKFASLAIRILDLAELTYASDLMRLGMLLEFIGLAIDSHYKEKHPGGRNNEYSKEAYADYAANYIRANFATVKISDVACYVGLHRSYLTNIFKKRLGVSPQEYLMQTRIQRARLLLLETDLPVQEVSQSVGYENPLTFSKIFKNYYGESPKLYRQNHRNELPEEEFVPEKMPVHKE